MDAVPHDADIDQVRERSHKRVHAAIQAVLVDDPRAHIGPGFGIEHGQEMVLLVNDHLIHVILPLSG